MHFDVIPVIYRSSGGETGKGGICPVGHYCPVGTTIPLPCKNGYYNNVSGQAVCHPCPAGYYCLEGKFVKIN